MCWLKMRLIKTQTPVDFTLQTAGHSPAGLSLPGNGGGKMRWFLTLNTQFPQKNRKQHTQLQQFAGLLLRQSALWSSSCPECRLCAHASPHAWGFRALRSPPQVPRTVWGFSTEPGSHRALCGDQPLSAAGSLTVAVLTVALVPPRSPSAAVGPGGSFPGVLVPKPLLSCLCS